MQECIMKVRHAVLLSEDMITWLVSYSVMLRLTSGCGRERPDPSLMKFPYDLSPNSFILHCILQYTTQDNIEILRRIFPHQLGLHSYPKKVWKSRKFAQFLIFLLSIINFQDNELVAQRVLTNQSIQPFQSGRCPLAQWLPPTWNGLGRQ